MHEKTFSRITLATPPMFFRCEPGWSWSPPTHGDYDFWLILSGEGNLYADDQHYPLSAGSFFLFGPETKIRATHDPKNRLRVFAVHFTLPKEMETVPFTAVYSSEVPFYEIMTQRCVNLWQRGDPSGQRQSKLILETLLLHFFDEALRTRPAPVDEKIQQLMEEISSDPGADWTVDELARHAHLSRSQLTRRFTALTGLAPMNYVIRARISRARWLLRETCMSVSEIANALGYSDLYFFSRQFKKQTGQPPSALRR